MIPIRDKIIDSGLHSNSKIGLAQQTDHIYIRSTRVGDLNLDGNVTISDFLDLASNFGTVGTATWQDKANWYLDQLKAKGMKVQAPSAALAAGFQKVGEQLSADWLKKAGVEGASIVNDYIKTVRCGEDEEKCNTGCCKKK